MKPKNIDTQTPEGYYTILKNEIPGRYGAQRNENVCNFCDWRKDCQANIDNACKKYPCVSYKRNDERAVIFKRIKS